MSKPIDSTAWLDAASASVAARDILMLAAARVQQTPTACTARRLRMGSAGPMEARDAAAHGTFSDIPTDALSNPAAAFTVAFQPSFNEGRLTPTPAENWPEKRKNV